MLTSIFTKGYLISSTVVSTLFLLLVETHLWKSKRHIISSTFLYCPTLELVSVRASKIHLNQWNIISITLQKCSLKRDKIFFVFTKLSWEPILDDVVQSRSPYFLLSFLSWASNKLFQICFREFATVQGECKCNAVYFTYDGWLQALSNTFKLSVVQPASIVQADIPVLYNPYRRFKPLNVVF